MRIAAELRDPVDLREGGMEITEKPSGHAALDDHGAVPHRQGESLELSFEDLIEGEFGPTHGMGGVDNRVWFWTARAYSRHTSWGASWT
jgi:hypothetical protein